MADIDSASNPFLTTALTRWKVADTAEQPMRQEGEKDLQFLNLEQWDPDVVSSRGESRPCLTIDQIGEPYRQLVGQMRSSKPAIQVSPVDSGADIDTAEVFQGLIRHIEITGHAKPAREEAFKGAVGPGWGYYRLFTEFEYDQVPGGDLAPVFDQCIKYQAIENQFNVFRDPATPLHEPWKCNYAFIIEDVPMEEFKAKWPDAIATQQDAFASTGIAMPDWFPEGSVRVVDYFYVEEKDGPEFALLEDGSVVPSSAVPKGVQPIQTHKPKTRVVKLAKITGAEVLEGNEDKTAGRDQPWPFIPIVPMYGESLTVKGKRTLRGIVRAARDPQRQYNYQASELVYELALSPKSKVMAPAEAIEPYAKTWATAASQAHTVLPFVPYDTAGRPMEPKVAQFTDPAKVQAITIALNQAKSDCRTTTGWYDATDPNRKNADQSGRAILARKDAQAEGAVNYKDNFRAALIFEGMLLLGAIPKIYNRPGRVLRIVGLEDETETEEVIVGQQRKTQRGVAGIFQWGAGRFDVVADVGASYSTRRQEAADFQLELMKVLPEPMAAAMAPIAVRNMDGPGNREIADRLDRTLPPNIREEDGSMDPQQLAQENAQLKAVLEQDAQVIKGLQDAVKQDMVKAEADIKKQQDADAAKLQIERLKAEVEMAKIRAEMIKLQAELDAEAAKIAVQEETKRLLKMADLQIHQQDLQVQQDAQMGEQAHERGMAGLSHQQELETGEQGHVYAMEQQKAKPKPNGADA
jgi:hypothetical protein